MTDRPIHLEGMGVIGSMLAWRLEIAGRHFTWYDTEHPISAWPASTGSIYPSGDPLDQECYERWATWLGDEPWTTELADVVEKAAFWFSSKNPPHGGKFSTIADLGYIRMGDMPSFHVNIQEFVRRTRRRFADRNQHPHGGSRVIMAHGFGPRLVRYMWGWSAHVRLWYNIGITDASGSHRPSLYLRRGRYIMAYAYPVPGTDCWYAGSSMISQWEPKELEILPKVRKWEQHLREITEDNVRVTEMVSTQQGWRPYGHPADDDLVREENGVLQVYPARTNGVRWAPAICRAVMERL